MLQECFTEGECVLKIEFDRFELHRQTLLLPGESNLYICPPSGESGLVYKVYIDTAVGKELVAVKTGKGMIL